MNVIIQAVLLIAISSANFDCSAQASNSRYPKEVYQSGELIVIQIAENSFQHTSFKQTNDYGNVPCNGLIVRNRNEAIVFDTPANNESSVTLIKWINDTLGCKINAIIPTHFHDDCLGGLQAFDENNIPSYASLKTIELATAQHYITPKHSFNDSIILKVGDEIVRVKFFGEGHTKDNVVGFFPSENVMFGGCLIKELNAGKGYLGDANIAAWPGTVEKIRKENPNVEIIVPGHGRYGNKQLLDYTIDLFREQ